MASFLDNMKIWLSAYSVALLTFIAFSRGVFQGFPFGYPWGVTPLFVWGVVPDIVIGIVTGVISAALVWAWFEFYSKHLAPEKVF